MKSKKIIAGMFIIAASIVTAYIINDNNPTIDKVASKTVDRKIELAVDKIVDGKKISISEGKSESFEGLTDLEESSDVIILGEKKDAHQVLTLTPIGTINELYTKSDIVVKKVYKGFLEKKDLIVVDEPIGTFNGVVSSYEGYEEMKPGNEYVLFLYKADNGLYGISGVLQGKHNYTGDFESYMDKNSEEYNKLNKLTQEIRNKYK